MQIESVTLRTIYNSRVNLTVEAAVNDTRAAAPSGASTGSHEAHCHVPDDLTAVEQELHEALVGEDLTQTEFDQRLKALDGSSNFEQFGAAAIAASCAFRKAHGFEYSEPQFPHPVGNLVGGGAHGGNTSIQEFLVVPAAAETVPEAMETLAEIYHAFRDKHRQRINGINDEGAFVTSMDDESTLDAVHELAAEHGARVGIDMAANEFYKSAEDRYDYAHMNMTLPAKQQGKFVQKLIDQYNLAYVEDPFHEEDFEQHAALTDDVGDCCIVGDDLFSTNTERLQHGIDIGAGNSIIVKPNQIGTVSAACETLQLAQDNNYTPIVSHRSGETCDPVIADLAISWGAPLIKAGIAGIRTAKNNQLLRRWDQYDGKMTDLPF